MEQTDWVRHKLIELLDHFLKCWEKDLVDMQDRYTGIERGKVFQTFRLVKKESLKSV